MLNRNHVREFVATLGVLLILVSIFVPILPGLRGMAMARQGRGNAGVLAVGALMYTADYDDKFPLMDNNGSCAYGNVPCDRPDWGDLRQGTDPNARPMFMNVIRPYVQNWPQRIYAGQIGPTNWPQVFAHAVWLGLMIGGSYNPALEDLYYGSTSFYAVNIMVVRLSHQTAVFGAPGDLLAIARPAEVVLVGSSVWDNNLAADLGLGLGGIWASMPGSNCSSPNHQGWTWYYHGSRRRSGSQAIIESGYAEVGYADGHLGYVRKPVLERCEFWPQINRWVYPHWEKY